MKSLEAIWNAISFLDSQKGSWIILSALRQKGGKARHFELRDLLCKTQIIAESTLSKLLRKTLLEKNLLTRDIDPLTRKVTYTLTEKGIGIAKLLQKVEEALISG